MIWTWDFRKIENRKNQQRPSKPRPSSTSRVFSENSTFWQQWVVFGYHPWGPVDPQAIPAVGIFGGREWGSELEWEWVRYSKIMMIMMIMMINDHHDDHDDYDDADDADFDG